MTLFNLIVDLDKRIGLVQSEAEKNDIQLSMFLIECKYNLDILDALDLKKISNDNPQIRSIVMLLSNSALELLISKGAYKSDSLFMNFGKDIFSKVKYMLEDDSQPQIKNTDTLLFNLYKRITVLKALASVEPPYTAIKDINYKVRLKHLNKILLDINAKIILNKDGTIK
jgi:hypothetical protein